MSEQTVRTVHTALWTVNNTHYESIRTHQGSVRQTRVFARYSCLLILSILPHTKLLHSRTVSFSCCNVRNVNSDFDMMRSE